MINNISKIIILLLIIFLIILISSKNPGKYNLVAKSFTTLTPGLPSIIEEDKLEPKKTNGGKLDTPTNSIGNKNQVFYSPQVSVSVSSNTLLSRSMNAIAPKTLTPTAVPSTTSPPMDNNDLRTAVTLWLENSKTATDRYGDISTWNVSNVTDMSEMFQGADSFNADISGWDVSNVTNMAYMFRYAKSFTADISDWKVGNVKDMSGMFVEATSFNPTKLE